MLLVDALAPSTLLKFCGKLLQSASYKETEEHYICENLRESYFIILKKTCIFTTGDQMVLYAHLIRQYHYLNFNPFPYIHE